VANYNKVILLGNLTRDPQLSFLPSNTPVCEFGLAINRRWRGQDGNMQDETCFVDCQLYGRQAETFNQYMSKGRPVLVEGRLRMRQWEAQDGQKRSKLTVVVERFQFVGPSRAAGPEQQAAGPEQQAAGPAAAEAGPPEEEVPPPRSEDDIPF
jgi:single-strand DNA-binding protein